MVAVHLSERAHIILKCITQQGEIIWGRGTSDDKGGLIGILCAVFCLTHCSLELAHTA
jgi:hypothetical protein